MALKVDEDGHLADPDSWSAGVAEFLAGEAGISLTDAHWRVLQALRAFYAETGVAPTMRPLVRLVRDRVGEDLASSLALMRLFTGDAAGTAARLAGLPHPDKCLRSKA